MTDEKKPTKTKTETKTEPTVTVDGRKVTWGYSKKIQTAPYENVEVSIYMTEMVPEDEPLSQYVGESEKFFDMLKSEVWGAHDLEYGFTEKGRPELVVQVPTPLQQEVAQAQAAPPVVEPVPLANPPAGAAPVAAPLNTAPVAGTLVGVYPEIPTFCKDCGKSEFWDNRVQNDDKIGKGKKIGPDFKCKDCEGGSGNGSPIYREGSYDYNKIVGQPPAAPAAMQPPAAPTATQPPLTPANIEAPDEAPF